MIDTVTYYVIDSSSLIELNLKYPMDVFPTLWENIEKLIEKGRIISPREVLKELTAKDDKLKKWARKQKKLFKDLTLEQINIVKEILQKYPSLANSDNEKAAADPFVIALAVQLGRGQQTLTTKARIIVTEERLRGNRVRIPFVCKEYDLECIDIINMCRTEGWSF